jgi:5'-phosphate synthase pdxT subunit
MNPPARVGILSLQGACEPHRAAFARLGVTTLEVRAPNELERVSHLVLPGGESTTLAHLLRLFGLWERIPARFHAGTLALFGTCAGAILLARNADGRPPTFGLLDASIERNAYGRQVNSSVRPLTLAHGELPGLFIRAPRFTSIGPTVNVLAHDGEQPVALEAPGLLATTFHPELTSDPWFHARFLAATGVPRRAQDL